MSFAAEMKDFISAYDKGEDWWDKRADRKLKAAKAADYDRAHQPPSESDLNSQEGFTKGVSKVGDGGAGNYYDATDPANEDIAAARRAISDNESGGNYGALGVVTKNGDRAYGKYQVMGNNVPAWTEQYTGTRMTPEEFLKSPEAQDKVFDGEFGRLADRYGWGGAGQAWFGGEGSIGKTDRVDDLGTSVGKYGDTFLAGFRKYGGGAGGPTAVAAKKSAIPPPADTAGGDEDTDPNDADDSGGDGVEVSAASFKPVQQAQITAPAIPMPQGGQFAQAGDASGFGGQQQKQRPAAQPASSGIGASRVADAMLAPDDERQRRALEHGALFAASGGMVPDDDAPPDYLDAPAKGQSFLDWLRGSPADTRGTAAAADTAASKRRQAGENAAKISDRAPRDDYIPPAIPETAAQRASRTAKPAITYPAERPTKDDTMEQVGGIPLPTYAGAPQQGPPRPTTASKDTSPPRRDVSAEPARKADAAAAQKRTEAPAKAPPASDPIADRRQRQLRDVTAGPRDAPAIPPRGAQLPEDYASSRQSFDLQSQGDRAYAPPVPEPAPQQGPNAPPDTAATRASRAQAAARPAIPGRLAGEDRAALQAQQPSDPNGVDPNYEATPYVSAKDEPSNQVGVADAVVRGLRDTYSGVIPAVKGAVGSYAQTLQTNPDDLGQQPDAPPPGPPSGSASAAEPPPEAPPANPPIPTPRPEQPGAIPVPTPRPSPPGRGEPVRPVAPGRTAQRPAGVSPATTGSTRPMPAPQQAPQGRMLNARSESPRIYGGSTAERVAQSRPANPRTVGVNRQAVHTGISFLTHIFGFDGSGFGGGQQGAMRTPQDQAQGQARMHQFVSGQGATTPEEIQAIDQKIDPEGQMSNHDKVLNRYAQTYQYYMSRGMKKEAAMAAGSLMQYGGNMVSQLGNLSAASYGEYLKTGNPDALQHTLDFLNKAYEYIPDGSTFDVHVDPSSHAIVATKTDADGNTTEHKLSQQELPGFIRGAMDKSLYWQNIYQMADPAGARAAASRRATDERSARTSAATDARQQRGFQHSDQANQQKAAAKAEEGRYKVLTKVRPTINAYKRAQVALQADPENEDLKTTAEEAKNAMIDAGAQFDKGTGKYLMNVNGKWVVAE